MIDIVASNEEIPLMNRYAKNGKYRPRPLNAVFEPCSPQKRHRSDEDGVEQRTDFANSEVRPSPPQRPRVVDICLPGERLQHTSLDKLQEPASLTISPLPGQYISATSVCQLCQIFGLR